MKCPNCNAELRDGSTICHVCGTQIVGTKICDNCGNEIPANSEFCPVCGKRFDNQNFNEQQNNFGVPNFAQPNLDFNQDQQMNSSFNQEQQVNNQGFNPEPNIQDFQQFNNFGQTPEPFPQPGPEVNQNFEQNQFNNPGFNQFNDTNQNNSFNQSSQVENTNNIQQENSSQVEQNQDVPIEEVKDDKSKGVPSFMDTLNQSKNETPEVKKEETKVETPVKEEQKKKGYSPFLQIPYMNRYYYGKVFNNLLFSFSALVIFTTILISSVGPVFTVERIVVDSNNVMESNIVDYSLIDIISALFDLQYLPIDKIGIDMSVRNYLTTYSAIRVVAYIILYFGTFIFGTIGIIRNTYKIKNTQNITLDSFFIANLLSIPYIITIVLSCSSTIEVNSVTRTYLKETVSLGYGTLGLIVMTLVSIFLYVAYDVYKIYLSRDRYSVSASFLRNAACLLSSFILSFLTLKRTVVYNNSISYAFSPAYYIFNHPEYSQNKGLYYSGLIFFVLELVSLFFALILFVKYDKKRTYFSLIAVSIGLTFNVISEILFNVFVSKNFIEHYIMFSPAEIISLIIYVIIIGLLVANILIKKQKHKLDGLVNQYIYSNSEQKLERDRNLDSFQTNTPSSAS